MPPIQLLIKPASGNCNMHCTYCFYMDEMEKRRQASFGVMTPETLEAIVKKALAYADDYCDFAFQGGEPTLVGLDFYRELIKLQKIYNKKGVEIHNSIQTNGFALDEAWAAFFRDHHFLVGVSLDGVLSTHNAYRKSNNGEDTFARVMAAIDLLKHYQVDFNILTVVHKKTAAKVKKIYEFYKKNGLNYQQYIACLSPLGAEEIPEYALSDRDYGKFLIELFELWYQDLLKGQQPYIRQFENYIAMLLGQMPESCDMKGICSIQQVIEADGSVYPCDFFVLDDYCLGNIKTNSFEELFEAGLKMRFIEDSVTEDEACKTCAYYPLCRSGCGRHRLNERMERTGRNCFCESYKMFFDAVLPKMMQIAEMIRRR